MELPYIMAPLDKIIEIPDELIRRITGDYMDFGEALKAFLAGKKIRRASWEKSTYMILGTKDQYGKEIIIIYSKCYNREYLDTSAIFYLPDVLADDWETVE